MERLSTFHRLLRLKLREDPLRFRVCLLRSLPPRLYNSPWLASLSSLGNVDIWLGNRMKYVIHIIHVTWKIFVDFSPILEGLPRFHAITIPLCSLFTYHPTILREKSETLFMNTWRYIFCFIRHCKWFTTLSTPKVLSKTLRCMSYFQMPSRCNIWKIIYLDGGEIYADINDNLSYINNF